MPYVNAEMKITGHLTAKVVITLGIGISIALALFSIVRANETAQLELELTTRTAAHASAIRGALGHDEDVLNAIAALVEITPDLDRTGFELFTREFLSDHHEVQSLAWVPRVLKSDRTSFEIAATDRFKDFRIKERDNSGSIVEAAQRDEYYPIFIIQPLAGNLSASGFDLSSDPVRNALLEKAREYGSVVASAPMALLRDTASPGEFLMATPIYAGGVRPHSAEEEQELLTGFAIGVIKINDLVKDAIAPFEFSSVEYRLDDVSFSRTPILSSTGNNRITSPGNGTGSPVITEEIQVYGRTWSLNTALPGDVVDEIRTSAPWIVLMGALIITMGMAGYLVRRHGHSKKELASRNTERSRVLAINAELKDSVLNRNAEVDVLDQELTHAIRELSTLANMGRAVSAQKELDGVFSVIAQALPGLVDYDRLEISLFDDSGDHLNIAYVDGLSLPSDSDLSSNGQNPDPIPGIDIAVHYNDGAPEWEERRNAGLKSWIGVPMTTGSSNVGVIKIGSQKRNTYGELDMARLGRVAVHIAPATQQAMLQEELREQAADLEKSNADLEQFAYVASHDLQEPLRMISGFTQLLQKKYSAQLDETANEYISRAVDGALRMRELINSLLQYSRVQSTAGDFVEIDLNDILGEVSNSLEVVATESEAEITRTDMPVIVGDSLQISHIFQNLIHNAIKYRQEGVPPKINVSWSESPLDWQFTVSDNGIGIETEYFDRIFDIFQRLHTQDEYSGTGIGLALVRRIVERHNGRVWVESTPGIGTAIHFTISKKLEIKRDDAHE